MPDHVGEVERQVGDLDLLDRGYGLREHATVRVHPSIYRQMAMDRFLMMRDVPGHLYGQDPPLFGFPVKIDADVRDDRPALTLMFTVDELSDLIGKIQMREAFAQAYIPAPKPTLKGVANKWIQRLRRR